MKYFWFAALGILFGINMSQSGFLSWVAWQDMFLFRSWNLMGIIFAANLTGIVGIYLIKKFKLKGINGEPIRFQPKNKSFFRYALGGLIFGIGWTIAGCPGTTYTLIGHGYMSAILILVGGLSGTFFYGVIKKHLPH